MLTIVASLVVTTTPFGLHARAATFSEPTFAFVARNLSVRGVVRVSDQPRWFMPTRIEWRVEFDGVATIEGVSCEGLAFAAHPVSDDGRAIDAGSWGCRIAGTTAETWGIPVGTVATFSRASGALEQLFLPRATSLSANDSPCTGAIDLENAAVTRCELATPQRVNGVELPAGAVLHFTSKGRLRTATIEGETVTAAGRTWGPEFTPCGVLELSFEADGGLQPPQPDMNHEACCD
jgi:hypothetical protein